MEEEFENHYSRFIHILVLCLCFKVSVTMVAFVYPILPVEVELCDRDCMRRMKACMKVCVGANGLLSHSSLPSRSMLFCTCSSMFFFYPVEVNG